MDTQREHAAPAAAIGYTARLMRRLAVVVMLTSVAHAQLAPIDTNELAHYRAIVTLKGKFGVAKLDRALKPALEEALRGRGLAFQWGGKPAGAVRPLTIEPEGDVWMTLDVRVENGNCGLLSEKQPCIMARLGSLHRKEGGALAIAVAGDDLAASYREAIDQALAGFRTAITRPATAVEVVFAVGELDEKTRKIVADKIAPCATALANPLAENGKVDGDRVVRALWARKVDDGWHARFRARLLELDKACKLSRTPLAGRAIDVRRENNRYTISFTKP
jgi:hypothetical protein